MKPTHITELNLLDSKSTNLNINLLHKNTPSWKKTLFKIIFDRLSGSDVPAKLTPKIHHFRTRAFQTGPYFSPGLTAGLRHAWSHLITHSFNINCGDIREKTNWIPDCVEHISSWDVKHINTKTNVKLQGWKLEAKSTRKHRGRNLTQTRKWSGRGRCPGRGD